MTENNTLFVVATPIGNLEDVTLRALRVLREEANLVLAEDTRVTKNLLTHYDIRTPLERFDAQVEGKKAGGISDLFERWGTIALVSDAGTPAISDPGARLVKAAREAGIAVVAVPGASSLTAALSIAGVPADEFIFLGFPPHKKGRKTFFETVAKEKRTVVFFESPHRILKTLSALAEMTADRHIVVARELTKMYEEVFSGTPAETLAYFEDNPEKARGEFVVMLEEQQ